MLVVFGGLPGTGKTTIAQAVAKRRSAVYLRIDEIEQAIRASGALTDDVGPTGYMVAYALAASNLLNGCLVVADSVNPLPATREAWRATAVRAKVPILEVEIVCSDPVEHRRRVESRPSDIEGLVQPSWQSVLSRVYLPWQGVQLVIDTAGTAAHEAVEIVDRRISATAAG